MILLQLLIGPRFMSSFARRQSSSSRLYNRSVVLVGEMQLSGIVEWQLAELRNGGGYVCGVMYLINIKMKWQLTNYVYSTTQPLNTNQHM